MNLVVCRLNAYVVKERIHCFLVVMLVVILIMLLPWLSGATHGCQGQRSSKPTVLSLPLPASDVLFLFLYFFFILFKNASG